MANFDGAQPQAVPRFGSLVQWDDTRQLPRGLAAVVRNSRYRAESVGTRWGFKRRLLVAAGQALVAGTVVRYIAEDTTGDEYINLLTYAQGTGDIYSAVPFVQAGVTKLTTSAWSTATSLPLAPGLNPVMAQAFNKAIAAMGDLSRGQAPNLMFNPATGNLDPLSDKPVGTPWAPLTRYRVGNIACPSSFLDDGSGTGGGNWIVAQNGHLYRCTVSGVTDVAPPVWPTGSGAIVVNGSATFQEMQLGAYTGLPNAQAPITPTTAADGASPIIDGATVFVVLTYNSTLGEATNDLMDSQGNLSPTVLMFKNTTGGPVDLSVIMPAIPAQYGTGGIFGPTQGASSYNVYAYIVQGIPDSTQYTDPSFYAQVAANKAPGSSVTISAYPTGLVLPQVTTAPVAPAGNVDVGVRYMIVLFQDRNGTITGYTTAVPFRIEVTAGGYRVFVDPLPIGPYNTAARICAFTVAGQSSAGPYRYIFQDDVESPGQGQPDVPITATVINDNVTTSATFNFTDTYLPGASDVTNYSARIEAPPSSDVYFSEMLSMVVLTGGYQVPSGHFVSDLNDPGAFRLPGSNIQIAEANGDRTVCWRELRDIQISCKENGGYVVTPNDGDPSTWAVLPLWRKRGPVGPKAIDIYSADDSDFIVFAHRDGLCRVTGTVAPLISREIQQIWKTINWAAAQQIVVKIDGVNEEVRVSLPVNGSTTNNLVITINYHWGWGEPVIFAQRQGKLVPNIEGRKWSLDDLAHADMFYVPQRFSKNVALEDADLANNLIAFGYDGAIYTENENVYHDEDANGNPVGYFWNWEEVLGQSDLNEYQLLGGTVGMTGSGAINVYARDDQAKKVPLTKQSRQLILVNGKEVNRDLFAQNYSTRFAMGFDNGGVADCWAEVHVATLYKRKWQTLRKG
jgi:hypothetical protein